ncbi:glycerol-3-phosphate dehydrogenase/oxidase [Rhodobacterales bacterium]|nr:glycerol-3-phosphate dehydrogenase/oxidase [Rhodobacterales bacterium]
MSEQRQKNRENLRRDGTFDVIVVGGGINGIGVYRELALQGVRVLLVERNDFCSGCSAAPSRMIHGGLRYLENGEFDLVRESLRERDALLKNAAHLVHPLPTVIPINSLFSGLLNSATGFFGFSGKPSSRGAVPIKIGLSLYDWVTRSRRLLPRHRFLSKTATRRKWPKLMPGLKFSAIYHDAWISHPERLGIELLGDVERDAPQCVALNHCEFGPQDGGYAVTDRRSGETFPVTTRLIVNATGAWLDETIAQIGGGKEREPLVSGTKGSHLVLDNPELEKALAGHMAYFENSDGRVCIVFPYLGKVLAGATDIRVKSAGRVACSDEEQSYILESLKLIFPEIAIGPSDVVFSYAGIRPLPKSDHDFTGRISRGHFTRRIDGTVPQICMIGGKWTTFRAFAEQAGNEILKELEAERTTDTLGLPIGGGRDFPATPALLEKTLVERFGIAAERAAYLVRVYGTRASALLEFCSERQDDMPIAEGLEITFAEAAWLIRQEFVETLSDLVLRRTSLAIDGRLSADAIDGFETVLRTERDPGSQELARQRAALLAEIDDYHHVTGAMLEDRNHVRSKKCV